jgi:hypothetical protein
MTADELSYHELSYDELSYGELSYALARLDLICREWQLPHPQTADGDALIDFCIANGISLDWLFRGKLDGLLRMTRARRYASA